ncbi:MAG: DUF1854 domain-containing protein [Halobacteriovoraceae bacterium]|jgi:hypothetical protein|nr:DUF1854 domain-containing protein [Halobacteriovoraceae bacterium]MBT5096022.1 DUF1854 domain-containing protein [Halobacteriovoraceae bacterium]
MSALQLVDDYKIFQKQNRQLYFKKGKDQTETEVSVKPCFPWTQPEHFLSLRDDDDNEVFLIEDLQALDFNAIEAVRHSMRPAQFILEINRINSIEEDVELRIFDVETVQGSRIFHTKLEDWPTLLDDGSILIEDLSGDTFKVEGLQRLDQRSQKILSTYVS